MNSIFSTKIWSEIKYVIADIPQTTIALIKSFHFIVYGVLFIHLKLVIDCANTAKFKCMAHSYAILGYVTISIRLRALYSVYCRSGNISEVLIFANFARTNSRIQESRENYFSNSEK